MNPQDEALSVTQADRDAIFDWLMLTTAEQYRDQIRGNVDRGEYDAMPMMSVVMFMRHRLSHSTPGDAEVRKDAADLLERYAAYVRTVKADDLELHPYLPEIERVAEALATPSGRAQGEVE